MYQLENILHFVMKKSMLFMQFVKEFYKFICKRIENINCVLVAAFLTSWAGSFRLSTVPQW